MILVILITGKLNCFFNGEEVSFNNEEDIIEYLDLIVNRGLFYDKEIYDYSLLIPLFVYLLENEPVEFARFYDICMKIHLSKDKFELFENGGIVKLMVPFSMKTVDMLDSVLSTQDYTTDIRTIGYLLDYINYERDNNCIDKSYIKYLEEKEGELITYLNFLGYDSKLVKEYYKYYDDTGLLAYKSFNDALDLIEKFIGEATFKYKNKFLSFKVLESKLKLGGLEENRKERLFIALTYRDYPSNYFYDCFSDLNLSDEDIVNFINKCEDKGILLDTVQLDRLINSYRKISLSKLGIEEEYNALVSKVVSEYESYQKEYAVLPSEFITYYNNKYPNADFTIIRDGVRKLDRDIYEIIINGNNLLNFSSLATTKTYNNYISSKGLSTYENDEAVYQRRKAISDKYFGVLDDILFTADFTIDYFIRKNIPQEDLEDFRLYKNWFDKNSEEKWDYSRRVQDRTLEQLSIDFMDELGRAKFGRRFEILSRYKNYLVTDKLSYYIDTDLFDADLGNYEGKFIRDGMPICGSIFSLLEEGKSFNDISVELGILPSDINYILVGNGFSPVEETSCWSYDDLEIINKFLNDKSAYSIKEFCLANNISCNRFNGIRENVQDEELISRLEFKVSELKAGRNGSNGECIKSIVDEIINSVKLPDGTVREFTYLDYNLRTNMPLKRFHKIATGEFGYNRSVGKFVNANYQLITYNEKSILAEKSVILLDGELHEITMEEKQEALDFINDMEFPHEVKLYSLVIKSLLRGELYLKDRDTSKPKVFVKSIKN